MSTLDLLSGRDLESKLTICHSMQQLEGIGHEGQPFRIGVSKVSSMKFVPGSEISRAGTNLACKSLHLDKSSSMMI